MEDEGWGILVSPRSLEQILLSRIQVRTLSLVTYGPSSTITEGLEGLEETQTLPRKSDR